MTISYTHEQLIAHAQRVAPELVASIESLFQALEAEAEAAKLPPEPIKPAEIPEDFVKVGLSADGQQIGKFLIMDGDYHIWIPRSEMHKTRPDISQGIRVERA